MTELVVANPAQSNVPPPAAQDWLSPGQMVALLKRNWGVILASGLVFGLAAFLCAALLIPKKYTAGGTLAVEMQNFTIPELQGALSGDMSPDPMPLVRSEVQVLSSRALVQNVVEDLNLVNDPEFNSALRGPSLHQRLDGLVQGLIGLAVIRPLNALGLVAPPKPEPSSPSATLDQVVGAVQHSLSIINDNRSLVIDVQFTAEDPLVSAAVVNKLIEHYMAGRAAVRTSANRDANAALEKRIATVRDELQQLEQRINETRKKNNLVQLRAGSVGQQQLEDLSAALTRASADRAQIEATYQRGSALVRSGGVGADGNDALNDPTISTLRDREATAERRVAQLAATLGPSHPVRRAAEAELASAQAALGGEAKRAMAALGAQAAAARQREADLKAQLADAQSKAGGQVAAQGELQQLEKDADAHRALYQNLLQSAEHTDLDKAAPAQSGARVVSSAVTPLTPSSPRPKLAGVVGLLSGFAFGGLLSAVFRRQPRGYESAEALTAETGIPAFAALPRLSAGAGSLAARVAAEPSGPEAEALRSLRTRLRFAARGSMPRSVLFVSSLPGEGNAGIAAAFARVAAIDGLQVLLIEGDLQSPEMSRLLEIAPTNGLVETLEGREHWQEAVRRDLVSGMDMLLVERPHPLAGQLLETMQLQNLLAEAGEEYNLVVMDAQPLSRATNSMNLAHLVDAVVLVVEAHATSRDVVRGAIETVAAAARRPPVVALSEAA